MVYTDNLQISNIDVFSNQFYPLSTVKLNQDITLVQAANEFYLAEEYDWTGKNRLPDPLQPFF